MHQMIKTCIGLSAFTLSGTLAGHAMADTFPSSAGPLKVEAMVEGLNSPWGFAFLPGGGMLITEKHGTLRLWHNGTLSEPLAGVPDVNAALQGGLLDIAIAPDFAKSRQIFFSFSEPDGHSRTRTAVAKAKLNETEPPALTDVRVIFRQSPAQNSGHHYGSRLVFAPDASLFVTIGDRGAPDEAQNTASHQGAVIRILQDGTPHPGNPFIGSENGAKPEIYSFGHRNPQGASLDANGTLWTVEHGARGGDEVNTPRAGVNHGWPVISYGTEYSGARIGIGTAADGMAQPLHYWDPSIAPSGLAFYDGSLFPEWQGDLFLGALKARMLVRLDLDQGSVKGEEPLFQGRFGRVRDVRQGPDGAIWFAANDVISRITPAR